MGHPASAIEKTWMSPPPPDALPRVLHCRTCGAELYKTVTACPQCGFNPETGDNHCRQCGATTQTGQIMCVECGTNLSGPTNPASSTGVLQPPEQGPVNMRTLLSFWVIDNGGPLFDGGEAFCWPALLWSWIWAFVYGQWKLGLAALAITVVFVPILGPFYLLVHLVVGVPLGLIGYNAASMSNPGRWESFAAMKKAMGFWVLIAAVLVVGGLVLGVVFGMLAMVASFFSSF